VHVRPVDDRLDAAAAGVDDDAHPIALLDRHRGEVDPAVPHRLLARAHREVDEAAHAARHLDVHHGRRVEAEHLGRDPDLERAGVEGLDQARPGDAALEVRPVGLEVVADRHDRAEAGDDGSAREVDGGHGTPFRNGRCDGTPGLAVADDGRLARIVAKGLLSARPIA
jgi:hypothetical protein